MSIYSDEVQQITDQLVADVTNLHTIVTNNPSDFAAIDTAKDTVQTTATSFDQAIKSADIPADNTMVLYLSTQLQLELSELDAAITANDSPLVVTITDKIVETTANINRCVISMKEQIAPIPQPEDTPLDPWFSIPTAPIP